jgi:hypothetical protein
MKPPPLPRAPAIQEQIAALDARLTELDQRTAQLAFEDTQGVPGSAKALAAHLAAVEAAKSQRDLKARALEVAKQHDREAEAMRIVAARALPVEKAIAGITRSRCADLCVEGSCALAGGENRCMHPAKGGIPLDRAGDRTLRTFQTAAAAAIRQQQEKQLHG